MNKPESQFYELGPFKLDTAESCLIHGGEVVPLTPKLFGLLMAFVQSGGGTLSKDDLAKAVWPDAIVTDAALAKNISRLKKILRDGEEGRRYIETLSGRGYRFVADGKAVHLRASLLDHITASPYMDLFTKFVYLRLIIYYGAGVECLAWYHRALNDLKRGCLEALRPRGGIDLSA